MVNHSTDSHTLSPDDLATEETITRWDNLQWRILSSCSRIWEAVSDILCNDSPEGYLPEDIEDIETIDTKDILSYSFRAIHESRYSSTSFLGGLLLIRCPKQSNAYHG